jgi:hypothetical protein
VSSGFPDYYGGFSIPVTVFQGGTGASTLTAHGVLLGQGVNPVTALTPGTSGYILQSNGAGADPSWVNAISSLSFDTITLPATGAAAQIVLHSNTTDPYYSRIEFYDDTTSLPAGDIGVAGAAAQFVNQAAANDFILKANQGSLWLTAGDDYALKVDSSRNVTLANLLKLTGGESGIIAHYTTSPVTQAYLQFWDDTASAERGSISAVPSAGQWITQAAAGDIAIRAKTGSLWLAAGTDYGLKVDSSRDVTLATKLKIATNWQLGVESGLMVERIPNTGDQWLLAVPNLHTANGTTTMFGGANIDTNHTLTINASIKYKRVSGSNGTPLTTGDFALSAGWGTGASVAGVNGTDSAFGVSVTAGATPGANPTITLTWKDGAWPAAPIGVVCMRGSTLPPGATFAPSVVMSTNTIIIQFFGTPTSGTTYVFDVITMGQ